MWRKELNSDNLDLNSFDYDRKNPKTDELNKAMQTDFLWEKNI